MSKILLVDDEEHIRSFCYELLVDEGHSVTAVPNGESVFKMIQEDRPDLIIMDIEIPGEKGLSLLKSLPNQQKDRIPVIIFSGAITPELEKEGYEYGVMDMVHKGSEPSLLLGKVAQVLKQNKRVFSEVEQSSSDGKNEKILVVDDEEGVRVLLARYFKRKGYDTSVASSGEECLDIVSKEKVNMVLLDVAMPGGMDGVMTLKKIKEVSPETGVVMATGVYDEAVAKSAAEAGAYTYVTKPFDMEYLEKVVLTRLLLSC